MQELEEYVKSLRPTTAGRGAKLTLEVTYFAGGFQVVTDDVETHGEHLQAALRLHGKKMLIQRSRRDKIRAWRGKSE